MKNHTLKLPCILALGVAAVLLACPLHAEDSGSQVPSPPQPPPAGYQEPVPRLVPDATISKGDRNFLQAAAKSGLKEAALSEAVFPNLATPEAKEFARMMVRDHTLANEELKALAAQKAVELPPEESDLAKKWIGKTEGLDAAYLKEMVSDHKAAVELFEKATQAGDPDIAAFAQKTLPVLRQHLERAKGIKTTAHVH